MIAKIPIDITCPSPALTKAHAALTKLAGLGLFTPFDSHTIQPTVVSMSYHPRIEEVSDSDPEEMDIEEFDDNPMANNSIIEPRNIPARAPAPPQAQIQIPRPNQNQAQDRERTKRWQVLYPLYFDSARSRADGRRVGKEHAVPNPLAREIVDAVQLLGLNVVFEPDKTHPKDWSNPGRVRVLIRAEGANTTKHIKNSSCYFSSHQARAKSEQNMISTIKWPTICELILQPKPLPCASCSPVCRR